MQHPKTIKIFLMDGDPNGRMSCELSNWSGKAYKIPRIKVKDCGDRSDLANTGVYMLFGKDESGNDQVYIGEAEEILKRLNQHLTQKDFWNEAIVFVSKDENLNKAHIKYMENRLYQIAKDVGRYELDNASTPTQSAISESDRAEMEEFISNLRLLVNTLGHKLFEEKRETGIKKKSDVFIIKAAKGTRGADAQGVQSTEGFVVFKGSKAASETVPSTTEQILKLRQTLIDKGILKKSNENLEFTVDYIFSSPSAAAAIVMGRTANGTIEWKLSDGRTLKDFEAK
ncbi:MAG: hypothetical protein OJF59_000587 [Cytophagales bacterium]|jgi:hypothetical protein|nr:GIY-YIG nuclease family protein [Bacteroidota bacterium]WHZ06834.1 MAG: hypothetical protein OJF59_000587 [Cytophagales bacterium]